MGGGVSATCSCGYEATAQMGCGRMGPEPFHFPAVCKACREIVSADMAAEVATCPECDGPVRFLDEPDLQKKKGRRTVLVETTMTMPERTRRLNDGAYLCPKCGQYQLRFEDSGLCWD